jgi:hypothetical protein
MELNIGGLEHVKPVIRTGEISIRISVERKKTSKPEFRGKDNIKNYFRETGYENGDYC